MDDGKDDEEVNRNIFPSVSHRNDFLNHLITTETELTETEMRLWPIYLKIGRNVNRSSMIQTRYEVGQYRHFVLNFETAIIE
jgi:hypothetical protein